MDDHDEPQIAELRVSYRYAQAHPWVTHAINGFLSAYFMEVPGFRVQRHHDELESGMHVWICEIPSAMKVTRLLKRLREDIPSCQVTQTATSTPARSQFLIDSPESDSQLS